MSATAKKSNPAAVHPSPLKGALTMNDALTKPSAKAIKKPASKTKPGKKSFAKKPQPAAQPDPAEDLMTDWHKPTGFETVNEALEDLKDFVQTLDAWHAEDCLRMMVNLGLLSRLVDRLEDGHNHVMLNADNDLDRALDRLLGPLGSLGRGGNC